ncbi:titin isoform X2 [Lucilia cuprina]|uniref:titin isoform X2 n=1 Tax=Lucilia cuprina TaxID=7375 RepID=UPI001F06E417|nr:titin isoform X2 [Lucilia cuprina]
MSLEGAKFICLDEAGNHGEIVLAKGRKFTMGYYVSCDFVLVDERAKGVHCEIECDAFGRVTIRNLSPDKPILVNGSTVEIKRILLNNSKLSILDKEYLWQFPKISSNEFEDLPVEAASTPQKQIGIPEQPPNSCPDFKLHRELPKRFTVHNFAYCIQSDEEGNTSTDSNDENSNEGESSSQTKQIESKIETEIKENQITDSEDTNANTQEKEPEIRNRSVTPEPKEQQNEKSTNSALMETPKMNLINCTKDKENKSTQKKNKQLLTMCHQSDVVITSFSPRETGVRIEKSFATVIKPKVLVTKTPATPKSVYSTPKSDLNENDDAAGDEDEKELMTFHTPSTSKKCNTTTASAKVLKNSSMHLIDLTTPNKLRPASPYLKSALKASAKKKIPNVDKSCGKLSSEEQLGLSALPSTPALQDNSNSPLETPSSVISVSSSTDTSSIIEVTSDGSNIGCTPVTSTGMTTPVKAQTRAGAFTPKRTPQSLMKRALITSAKKQNTTPQRNLNTAATPRRESINRIPLRSNLALLRTPVTPQASVGDKSTSQLPRRQSMSTPTRKSMPARSRFDSSPSTSTLASPSSSNRMASRRSSINPISAARALPTSTPVSGSSNNSALRTRAACKTSPLHKVRKSIGGVPLSSHISKARRSIVLPASTSKITSIKEKSPQQVMSDRLVTRARKSLCLTPISARSRNMVTAAKTPPQAPSSILKAKSTQSAKKPERKAVLFADKQPTVSGEVDDLSRTFIIDSDEEENAENQEDNKPKDTTFSPEKETKETDKLMVKESEKKQETIEIPVDVEEITSLSKDNKELEKPSNEEHSATTEEKEIAAEETEMESTENKNPIANIDKTKSIVTEESFAEIINDSQEIEEGEKLITETVEITDSPKETSQTESQESFTDALEEIVEENVKETEIIEKVTTEEPAQTLTQQSEEKVVDTGFGEESIVEIIENENVLEEIEVKNVEKSTENDENELKKTNQFNNENTNVQENEEVKPEETKSLELQEVEENVDKQKSSIYKPIVEDITLEGSLIEKETNVSKQPLYEDITLEGSLIEEKIKSEEIKDETSKESKDSNKILQTDESLKEEARQDDEQIVKNNQETESFTRQESKDIEDDKDVIGLHEAHNKDIVEEKPTASTSEDKSLTLNIEKTDNDLDDTSKLLEEIEDVLNKSDEIKQKHLIELEEGKLESEKPLTEEFESEKLTQEIIEETVATSNEENNEIPKLSKETESLVDSVEDGSQSLETAQEDKDVCNQTENESKQVTESLIQVETPKSSETNKTDEINKFSNEIESPVNDIDLQNEGNVEDKKENKKVSESSKEVSEIVLQNEDNVEHIEEIAEDSENIDTSKEDNTLEEERAQEESAIKETENIVPKVEKSRCDVVNEKEDPFLNEQKTELDVQNESSEINEADLLQNKQTSEEQNPDTTSTESKDSEPLNNVSLDEKMELSVSEKSEAEDIEIAVRNEETAEELESKENVKNDENAEELKENKVIEIEKENVVFQPEESSLKENKNEKQTTEIISNEQNLEKKSAGAEILIQEEDCKSPDMCKPKETETADKYEEMLENPKDNASDECEESKSLENNALQMEDNTPNKEKTESDTPNMADENISKIIQNQQNIKEQSDKSSVETVKDTISHSEADVEQKKADNVSDSEQANKSEEITNETEKPKEHSSISNIKKKIENTSSLTPRRSTRRASMSAETTTQTTTATESSFTPRRSTRRASMSAETNQINTTTESSFTPRRSARRASMSAETTTTATPTKRTTRRASLSVVSETTPLTPKTISKRRVSIDDETIKPSTSKTPRKLLEQRMVIPEEIEEVVESVIGEEEEENVEEKKTTKKRRSSTSSESKTSSVKTSIKKLESEEMSTHVVPVIIEEQDEPAEVAVTEELVVETKQIEKIENQVVDDESSSKEDLGKLTDVSNLAEKEKVVVQAEIDTTVSDATTILETASEEKHDALENVIATDNQSLNENEVAESIENENETAKSEVESVSKQDDELNTQQKSNEEVIDAESSNKTDEVDNVLVKEQDNLEKANIVPEVKENLDSSAAVDLNTSQASIDEQSEDEMENLQFEDDAETTPTKELKTEVKQQEISTPVNKKSVKILAETSKTPLMAGMRDLLKTPKAEPQTPRLAGIRDLVRTPNEHKESEQEEMEKLAVVADMIKTPKASKETVDVITPAKTMKQVTIIANSPKTPLMSGMRELLKTPKADMNTPQMVGIRHLVKTPKTTKENEQEEQEKLAVVAELVKTPQPSKNVEESVEELPTSSRKNVNLQGVKELLKTPKGCSTPRFKGMRELMQTPKVTNTPMMGGVKELLDTPAKQEHLESEVALNLEDMPATTDKTETNCMTPCGVKELLETPQPQQVIVQQTQIIETEEIPSTTSKTAQNLKGVKELLKTPKTCSTPRLKGIRELMQTPKMSSTPIMGGIKELMDSPAEKQNELDKFLRTPTAKNIMIPSLPSSAIIEKSSDSIEISTEYDLNATHDDGGETANLEELFKTPVASRFVERITDSYYAEEGDELDETVEKFDKTKNESLNEALNKSAEEAFDKMVGEESQIQTPIRKIYKRKSYALQTPQAPSPFSAADVLSDLPKTDVEEWIETLDQAETPSILECEDDNESIVEQINANDSVKETEEVSSLEQNMSANDSIIPETCTKVYLTEKSLTNITTASITKTLTKDPLLSATAKLKEKESRALTPIDAEISGIDLLDQTVESVQDEQPSMLDEPLLVEEPSMFEEPLVVSDDDDDTLNNADAEQVSQDEANDLSEPLMLSDSEDLNQSQDIETNEAESKQKQESNIEENVQEKSMVAQVSDVSLTEDPLENKNKEQEASIVVEEDKSIIDIEDDSQEKESFKVEDEMPKDIITESETLAEESLLFEETPMKPMFSEPQKDNKNGKEVIETAKNFEEEFAEVVDSTETENTDKFACERKSDIEVKEISIEETKDESNASEDIFLDNSVTEICEETSEEQNEPKDSTETNKESLEVKHDTSAKEENKQQLEHECQNIFMDSSNIDESFADEAVNEENDVENESAIVEVTTKEVIKEHSKNIPAEEDMAVLEATNEQESVQEIDKVVEIETNNKFGNLEASTEDHIQSVEETADEQQHVKEIKSLTANKLEEESCEKESKEAEVTANIVEEPSAKVTEDQPELASETSVVLSESSDEKQADVVKSDIVQLLQSSDTAQDQAELSTAIETKSSETSEVQLEDLDEKDAELVESDRAEVLESSQRDENSAEEQAELSELPTTIESKSSEALAIQTEEEKEAKVLKSDSTEILDSSQIEKQAELSELSSAGEKETEAIVEIGKHLELSELLETTSNETSVIPQESLESSRIEDTTENNLSKLSPQTENKLSETVEVPTENNAETESVSDEKQSETETADIVQEISEESCQPEDISKEQSELIEKPSQSEIKPSEISEIQSVLLHDKQDNKLCEIETPGEILVIQSESSDENQDEVETADVIENVSDKLESPKLEDTIEENSKTPTTDNKPCEISEVEFEQIDDKASETLEIKQESSDKTTSEISANLNEPSEEKVKQSNDDQLSKTSEESSKDNEELKQTVTPLLTEVIEEKSQESFEVSQSIVDFQKDKTLEKTAKLEESSIECKDADSSEIIADKLVSKPKDETETNIPSDVALNESSKSKHEELSEEIIESTTETKEINSVKPEESPKVSEVITEGEVTSEPVKISENKESLESKEESTIISAEKPQPTEDEIGSLTEEEDSTKTSEKVLKETQNESKIEINKSELTEKLTESTSEVKDSQQESTKPLEIVKSYNFEIKINDMDHKTEKESVEAKLEKPTTSTRSQATESSYADLELSTTGRTMNITKTEENITQIEKETPVTADEISKVNLDVQKSEEAAVESKESLNQVIIKVSEEIEVKQSKETPKQATIEVSDETNVKKAEVSSSKTNRRKRTVSESNQDSTQEEESHSRSRRDRRKIIKKLTEETLQEVEEEPQISKSAEVMDEKPKRKRTTSESSQGSVKDDESHTRRGRRKVQKPPVEETVVEQKEECEELVVEQKEEEKHQPNSGATEELPAQSAEAIIDNKTEASSTKETQLEKITSEHQKEIAVEINNEELMAKFPMENEAPSVELQKTDENESDKMDQDTPSEETIPHVVEQPEETESFSNITEETVEESKPTISENKMDSAANDSNLKTIELHETQNHDVISSEVAGFSNDVFKHKLSDVIELPEPEEVAETVEEMVIPAKEPDEQPIHTLKEVAETVQDVEEMAAGEPKEQPITETIQEVEKIAVAVEEPKEQPIKRGRRKPTVSESSQGSVHEDDNSRSRKTRRKVQKTPVEEAVVEEIMDTEELATTVNSISDMKETKQAEVVSKLSVEIEPDVSKLKDEQSVEVQCVTLEDVKEQTTKRGRRKPTVSESSQGSVHEDDTKHSRKGRRKIQKTPVEEIVPEESEEQITSQLETATSTKQETEHVLDQSENIEQSADFNKETKENVNENFETESATITLSEFPTSEIKEHSQELLEMEVVVEKTQEPVIKEHSQELLEMEAVVEEPQEPVKQTHVKHDDTKEHGVKRGRRKRDLPESLSEEPTTSRKGRRKVQATTTEEILVESTSEHKNLSNEVEVVTATETTKVEDVSVVDTVKVDQTVKENAIESNEQPREKLNEESDKTDRQVEAPKKQTVKRGGRRKIDAPEVSAAEDKPIELLEEHETNEVAESKSVKIHLEETVALENSEHLPEKLNEESVKPETQVDTSTKQTAKRGVRRKADVQDVPVETSTKVEDSVTATAVTKNHEEETNEELVKPEEVEQVEPTTKIAKRGGRRKVEIEEVPVDTNVEKHVEETNEEIKKPEESTHVETSTKTSHATRRGGRHKAAASEITTEDVSKSRSASRNRKTPAEHPTSEPELPAVSEKQTEIPTVSPDISKGRSASRNRKTPVEHPITSGNQENQAEVSKGRTTSRNRKTPAEQPMASNELEEQIESVKDVKEIAVVGGVTQGHVDENVVIIDESTDEENEKKQEDTSLKKRGKRTRTASETNQGFSEKPTKRRARHQVTEINENTEEKKPETVEEVQTDKDVVEKPQKYTRRRGAAASQQVQEEEEEHHLTKSRRKAAARHYESEEHQSHTEHTEEQTKSAEETTLSEVKITEVTLEPEDQHAAPQEENQKDVKIRKGRRKAAAENEEEHQQDEDEHETLAAVKRKAVVKGIEHDHEVESASSSKRKGVGKKNRHLEEHVVKVEDPATKNQQEHEKHEDQSSVMAIETSENTSTRRHAGRKKHDHDDPTVEKHDTEDESKQVECGDTSNKRRHIVRKKADHDEEVSEKHDTEEESIHIDSSDTSHKRRHVGRKKLEHEAEHGDHDTETEHPHEETKKGRTRRKKVNYTEEPDQPTTSYSPETKHRGRKRKESHTDTQEVVANVKEHIEEKSTKEPETKVVNPSGELQTPQRAAPIARRGRKASTIEHITAESQELADDTPGRRARNVPQRRAATAYHNYDETSDSEVTTKTKKKTDSPRKSLEVTKTSPTATITTAPIIDNSPSPSTTTATTTARGRTRKPTAKVQQFLEEERAKAETPKKKGLLSSAIADAATPQRTPARRGRKASTIETEVEGTPQASKSGRGGRGKQTAVTQTKEETETTAAVIEEKVVELHTTPPPAQPPAKGRRGGRKAKITEEEPNANSDEPPAKKSPLELESEKHDSSPLVEAPTPPTRTAGKRNAAAAAKARIEEDALAAAAIDPPKRSRAKKAPAKAATPVVATPDTDAHSSELEEEKGAKNKNSPLKREHRLTSASTIEGADDIEDDHDKTETSDKPVNKRVRKAATATTTETTEVPVKKGRKAKAVEEVADNSDTSGAEVKAIRGRGRGRKNVHFDEQQEAEASTSTQQQQQQLITNIEPTLVETPEPVKRGTRTRRK